MNTQQLDAISDIVGEAISEAVAPLQNRIRELEAQVLKPVDLSAEVERAVAAAVAALPAPKDGKDGRDGADGQKGLDGKDGRDGASGVDGKEGRPGADGIKGADGLGLAGAMIDRDGALQVTFTNGEVKSLGTIVGKDGADGKDGVSLDAFEMEYLPESHEIALKATAAGRVKELRYPAGGIRPAGYWREGTKAEAGEAWVHDGSLWIARKSTPTKPATGMDDWIIAARKGRDGERGAKGVDGSPPAPIKLGA